MVLSNCDSQHNNNQYLVSLFSMSFMLSVIYGECSKQPHYAEYRYAECHYAECRGPAKLS